MYAIKTKKSSKGITGMLTQSALGLVVVAALAAVGFLVLAGFNDSTTNAGAKNVISQGAAGITNIANQLGLFGTIVVFVALLFLVWRGLGGVASLGSGSGGL